MQSIKEILQNTAVKNLLNQSIKTESPIERILLAAMAKWGLMPKTQVKIGKYRVDILLEGEKTKLVVECDGKEFHKNIAGYEIDRDVFLLNQGYDVEHFSGNEIYKDPDEIVLGIVSKYFPEKWDQKKYEEHCSRPPKRIYEGKRSWQLREEDDEEVVHENMIDFDDWIIANEYMKKFTEKFIS
jgi:very-short-patch-repair endonuclease